MAEAAPSLLPAAVEQSQGPGNNGGFNRLLQGDFIVEMGFGGQMAVVVVFHGNLPISSFPCSMVNRFAQNSVLQSSRRSRGKFFWLPEQGSFPFQCPAGIPGIFEFFNTQSQDNVIHPAGHSNAGFQQGYMTRCTPVFISIMGILFSFKGICRRCSADTDQKVPKPCRASMPECHPVPHRHLHMLHKRLRLPGHPRPTSHRSPNLAQPIQ